MSNQRLLKSLRNTKVVVVHPIDEDCSNLERQLKRIGCEVDVCWPAPRRFPKDANAVFFLADGEPDDHLLQLAEERGAAMIAVIGFENPLAMQGIADAIVHGTLSKPIRPFGVLACLVTALSLFRYEQRLSSRIEKLDEILKTRRIVERATKILMERKNLSDDDAYGLLRREAMNKQVTLYEMANSIINADSLLL